MDARELIDQALKATGMTVDEMADRLDYKSLKRAMYGEIPLPDSKRKHIGDIVRLHELEKASDTTNSGIRLMEESQVDFVFYSPRKRLLLAIQAKKYTTAELAKRIGYDSGVIDRVVNGTGRITEAMAEKIVAELGPELSVEDLLSGSDMPHTIDRAGIRGTAGARPTIHLPGGGRTRIVPLISWAAAGELSTLSALDEAFEGEGVASTVPGRAFAVEISGDSMHPEINPGDFAVVKADAPARPGQVVLVRTIHGDVLCKRYSTRDREKLVILSSVNNSYAPIEILASEIAWIYPVKQVIRNY